MLRAQSTQRPVIRLVLVGLRHSTHSRTSGPDVEPYWPLRKGLSWLLGIRTEYRKLSLPNLSAPNYLLPELSTALRCALSASSRNS
jgi:hypothetical protein